MHRNLILATSAAAFSAFPAFADALLQTAKAISPDGPFYTLEMSFDDGANQFQLTIDQSLPKGERVTRVTPDPRALTGDAAATAQRLKQNTAGDIWCSSFADSIPGDAARVAETPSTATYAFTPLPGDVGGQMAKAYKFLKATAMIDKSTGAILSYEMSAPKSFKPSVAARIEAFSMRVACIAAPDGRTHVETFSLDLKGTAMMQAFAQSETRRISNLTQVAGSGASAR